MRSILFSLALSLLASSCLAADPDGWMVTVNSATGKWAAASGMTFNVPAQLKPDGSPSSTGIIDTGLDASLAFPGGIGVIAGWSLPSGIDGGHTSARLVYGFFTECGQGFQNGGNHMAAGTVTCTVETGSVSLTITPY